MFTSAFFHLAVIASRLNQQSAVRNVSPATIKAEPRLPQTLQHVPCEEVLSLQTSLPLSTSQEVTSNNDNMKIDVKPLVSVRQQPTYPPSGPVNVIFLVIFHKHVRPTLLPLLEEQPTAHVFIPLPILQVQKQCLLIFAIFLLELFWLGS